MTGKEEETFFIVTFRNSENGKVETLKARKIQDSTLGLSFIALSDFVFETQSAVVNPTEESLSKRFENVKCFHLSIYTVISIEEVGAAHRGLSFQKDKSNLVVLPSSGQSAPPPRA